MPTDINFLPKEDQPKRKPAALLEPRPVMFSNPSAVKEKKINQSDSAAKIKKMFSRFFKPKTTRPNESTAIAKDQISLSFDGGTNIKEDRDNLLRQLKNKNFNQEKISPAATIEPKIELKEELKQVENKKEAGVSFAGKNSNSEPMIKKNKRPRFDLGAWLKAVIKKYQENRAKRQSVKSEQAKLKAVKIKPETKPLIMPEPIKSEPEFFNKKSETMEAKNSVAAPTLTAGQDILRTNLISDQDLVFFNWPKAIKINIVSIVASLLIIGASFIGVILLGRQAASPSDLDAKLAVKDQEQKSLESELEKLSGLRAKTAEIKNILSKHIYWTNFFNLMEKNTLTGIYYDDFEGDISGQYLLPAVASDFKILNAQIKTWQGEKNYVISAVAPKVEAKKSSGGKEGAEQDVLAFEINLAVKPDIFYQP
ncbi:MAG: hypothetical protein WCV41_01690 [Patescibacteria group bacterium]